MTPAPRRKNHSAFGSQRERAVKKLLEAEGWVVFRCAASKPCDLVALREPALASYDGQRRQVIGNRPWLIEVKGTARSPWVAWGPKERAELVAAAKQAGAVPLLAWWPPHGRLRWIGEAEWPS